MYKYVCVYIYMYIYIWQLFVFTNLQMMYLEKKGRRKHGVEIIWSQI